MLPKSGEETHFCCDAQNETETQPHVFSRRLTGLLLLPATSCRWRSQCQEPVSRSSGPSGEKAGVKSGLFHCC